MHLRGFPRSAGACSALGYTMKLWRIRSLTTTSPDPEAAVMLLQGGSQTQTIQPGCLQGSAPPGQGLCGNGISEHTGRATYFCLKAAEEPSSFSLPPHPGLQSPAPGKGRGWRVQRGGAGQSAGASSTERDRVVALSVPVLRAAEALWDSQARGPWLP